MKPETVLLLRKLAREATMFALLGILVATIGIFVFMDNQDRANAKRQAAIAVHAVEGMYALTDGEIVNTLQVPLTNGTVLRVR